MLRASLRCLVSVILLIGLAPFASAETSNWGLNRTPDAISRLVPKTPTKASSGGGGGSTVKYAGPPHGAPAQITIVTQPPQCGVQLETFRQIGAPQDNPDVSRYKMEGQAGKRQIVVSKTGYQSRQLVITVDPGQNAPVLVTLDRDNYETLFKELIQVYTQHYNADHDDGNALLHLIYLNRLMKNYREVDRLEAALKANPRIDVREETVKLETFALDTLQALEAQKAKNQEAQDQFAQESADAEANKDKPQEIAPSFAIGPDGKPIKGLKPIGNLPTAQAAAVKASGGKPTPPKIININPFFYAGMVGWLYSSQLNDPDNGLKYLKAALQTELGVPLLWYDTGVAMGNKGQFNEAYNAEMAGYHLDPDHAWILSELSYLSNIIGHSNGDKKMIADADYYGKKSIEKDPKYLGGYMNLITLDEAEGKMTDAEAQAKAAINIDPTNPELYGVYGDVLRAEGREDAASAEYQKSLEIRPNYAYGLYGLGRVAEDNKDFNTAIAQYTAASQSDPTFTEPLLRLANIDESTGKDNDALQLYYQVTQINDGSFDAWFHQGGILFKNKQYAKSGSYFYKAFELNPTEPWTIYSLAQVAHQLGDNQKALDFYEAFTEVYTTQDSYLSTAQNFVKSAKALFNLTPTKYKTDQAAAGDTKSFMDQFFGDDQSSSGTGGGPDLTNNFKPSWAQNQEPDRGNVQSSGGSSSGTGK